MSIELKHRYGGHGGIATEWEIRVHTDVTLDRIAWLQENYGDHYGKMIWGFKCLPEDDLRISAIVGALPSLWPIQHNLFPSGSGIDLPQGTEEAEAHRIVAALLSQDAKKLLTLLIAIQQRTCPRCRNYLIIKDYVHSCEGNNYNIDESGNELEHPHLYSGCLQCDNRCHRCEK